MEAWKGGTLNFGDVLGTSDAFSMDDGDWPDNDSNTNFANAAPVVMVAQERVKKEKSVDELKPVEPADEAKGSKKAKTTLCKWGWSGSDVEAALVATASASAVEQGQAAFNKQRQVTALDWLLLNAPENSVPVDYRNDAMKARS